MTPALPGTALVSRWLRSSRAGLAVAAIGVGVGAGLGAVAFRLMIQGFTRAFTGYSDYGVQGHVSDLNWPHLGPWFVVLAPAVGGLIYGPLIYLFAREARGHGVPEVMLAVAENGGRIRPQVALIKALASALCIGSGGSVGREGPIVQIGSALASSLGQAVRMPEGRLRLLVACGAAGAISATFNAPLAGVFFAIELILREVSLEAWVATALSAMTADIIGRAAFGAAPFFTLPNVGLTNYWGYLLTLGLGILAGGAGVGFSRVLYLVEDGCDWAWRGRPEWLRPSVGGVILGLLLFAIPQLYGVGYPVLQKAVGGGYALPFVILLLVGKMVASSLTIGIGGSGGVFAPSLFMGGMLGTAFGLVANHYLGGAAGPVVVYGMIGMGSMFAGAARAPLTSITSILEMTGAQLLVLPVMLGVGAAAVTSHHISKGTVYTTKLLRRGIDIERPKPATLMQQLVVADAMQMVPKVGLEPPLEALVERLVDGTPPLSSDWTAASGVGGSGPQAVFASETLEQALRQLVVYGHQGLPVLGADGQTLVGWLTNRDVMRTLAKRLGQAANEVEDAARAAEFGSSDPDRRVHDPTNPLSGYTVLSLRVPALAVRQIKDVPWPPATLVISVRREGTAVTAHGGTEMRPGDLVTVVTAQARAGEVERLVAGAGSEG